MIAKLNFDELRQQPCYLSLTVPQRALIEAYLQTGSKLEAVKAGYPDASLKSARVMASRLFRSPRIVAVLTLAAGGDSGRAQFEIELQRKMRSLKVSKNQIAALRLYAEIHGFLMPKVEAEVEAPAGLDAGAFDGVPASVPADALEIWTDPKTGMIIGYRDAGGEAVKL